MNTRSIRPSAFITIALAMTLTLTACGDSLPPDATEIVFGAFNSGENPQIDSAQQAEPLPEDLAAGADQVWCVNLTFTCWSCAHGEYQTCADSRLVRRIGDEWQVSLVLTGQDKELWKARGCKLIENRVQ